MDLTKENKEHIDSMSYEGLLQGWRFAPVGSPWFQGETGKYWSERMKELGKTTDTSKASKNIGWGVKNMTVWRCSNCKHIEVGEEKEPCKSCNGKSHWVYDKRLDPLDEFAKKSILDYLKDQLDTVVSYMSGGGADSSSHWDRLDAQKHILEEVIKAIEQEKIYDL